MKINLFLSLFILMFAVFVESKKKTRMRLRVSKVLAYGFSAEIICQIRYPESSKDGLLFRESKTGERIRIEENNRYSIYRRGNKRSIYLRLTIEGVKEEDEGKYICQSGKMETSGVLKVPGTAPKVPTAEFFAKSYYVAEGGRLAIYCLVKQEASTIFYRRDGSPVLLNNKYKYDTQYKFTKLGNDLFGTLYKLELSNIQSGNDTILCRSGNYADSTKIVVYSKGETDSRRRLYFKSTVYSVYPSEYRTFISCAPYSDAQIFKITSNDTLLSVKSYRNFRARTMIIRNASPDDAGYYLCKKGDMNAVTHVNYFAKSSDPPFVKPKSVKVGAVVEIGNVKLHDEIRPGFATGLQWHYLGKSGNDKPVKLASKLGRFSATSNPRYVLSKNGGSLIIKNITTADAGYYRWQHRANYVERITYQLKVQK